MVQISGLILVSILIYRCWDGDWSRKPATLVSNDVRRILLNTIKSLVKYIRLNTWSKTKSKPSAQSKSWFINNHLRKWPVKSLGLSSNPCPIHCLDLTWKPAGGKITKSTAWYWQFWRHFGHMLLICNY